MKAHELLTEETWIQGAYALDAADQAVLFDAPEACQWCLVGALQRCYVRPGEENGSSEALEVAFKAVAHHVGRLDVEAWNDAPQRTFAEVYDVLVALDI